MAQGPDQWKKKNGISVAESQVLPGLDESSPTTRSHVPPGESLAPLGTGACICAMLTRPLWRASVSLRNCRRAAGSVQAAAGLSLQPVTEQGRGARTWLPTAVLLSWAVFAVDRSPH